MHVVLKVKYAFFFSTQLILRVLYSSQISVWQTMILQGTMPLAANISGVLAEHPCTILALFCFASVALQPPCWLKEDSKPNQRTADCRYFWAFVWCRLRMNGYEALHVHRMPLMQSLTVWFQTESTDIEDWSPHAFLPLPIEGRARIRSITALTSDAADLAFMIRSMPFYSVFACVKMPSTASAVYVPDWYVAPATMCNEVSIIIEWFACDR